MLMLRSSRLNLRIYFPEQAMQINLNCVAMNCLISAGVTKSMHFVSSVLLNLYFLAALILHSFDLFLHFRVLYPIVSLPLVTIQCRMDTKLWCFSATRLESLESKTEIQWQKKIRLLFSGPILQPFLSIYFCCSGSPKFLWIKRKTIC